MKRFLVQVIHSFPFTADSDEAAESYLEVCMEDKDTSVRGVLFCLGEADDDPNLDLFDTDKTVH